MGAEAGPSIRCVPLCRTRAAPALRPWRSVTRPAPAPGCPACCSVGGSGRHRLGRTPRRRAPAAPAWRLGVVLGAGKGRCYLPLREN